jgi:hypothetical protein
MSASEYLYVLSEWLCKIYTNSQHQKPWFCRRHTYVERNWMWVNFWKCRKFFYLWKDHRAVNLIENRADGFWNRLTGMLTSTRFIVPSLVYLEIFTRLKLSNFYFLLYWWGWSLFVIWSICFRFIEITRGCRKNRFENVRKLYLNQCFNGSEHRSRPIIVFAYAEYIPSYICCLESKAMKKARN